MNEQIKQFAVKSGLATDGSSPELTKFGFKPEDTTWSCAAPNLEKFAELIIQECVGVADAYVRGDVDSPWYSPTARSRIGIKIQEHFGI